MTSLRVGSASDTGRVRTNNQDSTLVTSNLFAVADGMGGHQGGEVASAIAVAELLERVQEPTQESLRDGIRLANRTIFERAGEDPDLRGMGTTIAAMVLVDNELGDRELAWANVGDSRIYLYRDGRLQQLSEDHSLVEDLRRDGQLTEEEAAVHPQRNILTRALGIDAEVEIDSASVLPYVGDRFLLCSDGLFNEVELDRISATLRRVPDPDEAAADLVRLANEHGGRDNVTCVIVDVTDDDDRALAASAAIAAEPSGLDAPTRPVDLVEPTAPPTPPPAPPTPPISMGSTAIEDGALPFGRGERELFDDLDRARSRHITWRVVLFLLALLAVFGVAFGAVGWYANRTYYMAFAGSDEVAIFRGRPGGVLWFDPMVEQSFAGLTRNDLTPAEVARVEGENSFSNRSDAERAVDTLRFEVDERTAATTTTTTSTSRPTTTTTTSRPTTTAPPPPTTGATTTSPP